MELIVRINTAGKPEIVIVEEGKILLSIPESLYQAAVQMAKAIHTPVTITKTGIAGRRS